MSTEFSTNYALIHEQKPYLNEFMANRLPAWIFLLIALILMGFGQYPLLRVMLGLDEQIAMPPSTMAMVLIGGLMCGLTAMILLVRRIPPLPLEDSVLQDKGPAVLLHASGLLLFCGIPLANFLVCYFLWLKYRHQSSALNKHGIAALNFQISVYLYLLLSLFMIFAILGFITTPLLLVLYLVLVLIAVAQAARGKLFNYPAGIPIIQGRARS